MPFRIDPGLGRASWAAMMRPSCYKDSRPSSPCSTTTAAPAGLIVVYQGVPVRLQLQGVPLELHRVVPGHSPFVFEAQDLAQAQIRRQGSECRIRARGGNLETPVVSRQELFQHGLGLFNGGCSGQPGVP